MGCDLTHLSARRTNAFWRLLVVVMAIASVLALSSCGGSSGGDTKKVKVTISPATTTITPSSSVTLQATVTGATDERVTWSASGGGTVTTNGVFTAPATTGVSTVTATSVEDPTASATATITVSTVSGVVVQVTPTSINVAPGGEVQLTATVTGTTNKRLTWTATGGSVDSDGLFTAPSTTGAITVTATSVADPSASAFSRVTVTTSTPVVNITPLGASLATNGTQQFTATVSNTSNQNVTWSATGGTISSTGLYHAGTTAGSFKVTATSQANPSVSASANVTITAIGVSVTPNGATGVVGVPVQFNATVTGTSNKNVTWSTSAGSISATGLLTPPATAQTVTVTATSVADPSAKGTGTITITDQSDFTYNFESGVPGVWTPTTSEATPTGARKFLGRMSGSNAATLTLSSLTTHKTLTISFDLFVIGGWTGATASSQFTVNVNGSNEFVKTFSNIKDDLQTYPDGDLVAPGTGATEKNSLGYTHDPTILYNDCVYHITMTVDHTSSAATIKFLANLTGTLADQAWGIDNVKVHANP